MRYLVNKKGTMLIATYLVLFVIIVTTAGIFSLILNEKKLVIRNTEEKKALSNAEMGMTYAVFESQNLGWQWYTHKWKTPAKQKLVPLAASDTGYHQQLMTDCSFDANGFFVANNGEFMVKAYQNADNEDETIIVAMGMSGEFRKVLKYTLSRKGIYDFFYYSPYDIDLNNAVGTFPHLNGGGIHTNGNIYFDYPVRLDNVSELSTGKNGAIYYRNMDRYPAPRYLDNYDGTYDGQAPIVRLDTFNDVFRDDAADDPGPFGYYYFDKYGTRHWTWKSYATYYAHTSTWPTTGYRTSEWYFAGDSSPWNNIAPGANDNRISSSITNDNTIPLNGYNVWIKPYLGEDALGNIISDPWTQIPAELPESWDWRKYDSTNSNDQPVQFYTYDDAGSQVSAANSYWDIVAGSVVMVDPADLALHPGAKTYWDMFQSQEYWDAIGRSPSSGYDWTNYLDTRIYDGVYGDEINDTGLIPVEHTFSTKQPSAWADFLTDSGLDGIVKDGATGGEDLEPPVFDVTYLRLADRGGLFIPLDASFDGDFDDFTEWQTVLESSIDDAVTSLNDAGGNVAQKVKFINTYTGQWNVVLEIDLAEMQLANKYPDNGIVYSQVPLRLTNAEQLPRKMANYGFTVLGEENIYLKGDYNKDDWVTSAIITKKRVFTLSDDFNDPQIIPATEHYRDYPYMYIKEDPVTHVWAESDPTLGGGEWVSRDRLNHSVWDYYSHIPDANEQTIKDTIYAKDAAYRALFDHHDTTGTASATFTWAPSNESYTYGMMPNHVYQNHTYNTLIASYRGVKGNSLEDWIYNEGGVNYYRRKYLNGAFFILDQNGEFTADYRDFIDYERWTESPSLPSDISLDRRGRLAYGATYSYADVGITSPYTYMSYDKRFKTATRSPADVFFGGAQALWIEATVDFFYQLDFT